MTSKHALMSSRRRRPKHRLAAILNIVREMSRQTDPWQVLTTYADELRRSHAVDRALLLNRRGLKQPGYRITHPAAWKGQRDPWTDPKSLPVLEGGLLGELLYAGKPRVIRQIRLGDTDPGAQYLSGQQSLAAVPQYEEGQPFDMAILLRRKPSGFEPGELPGFIWLANLMCRVEKNVVLARKLRDAYALAEKEMKDVADVQRSLLPTQLPNIPGLELAAHYETASRAGGDYYDFFPLPDGRWGILIADASGHGAPAAVLMAIMRTIVQASPRPPSSPSRTLQYINRHFCVKYVADSTAFVTAFFCVFDPRKRSLIYSCAGHPPPRIRRARGVGVGSLDRAASLPLGVLPGEVYRDCTQQLQPGDRIVFYTDGITDAVNSEGERFDVERLDAILRRSRTNASSLMTRLLRDLGRFAGTRPLTDDRTLLVADVKSDDGGSGSILSGLHGKEEAASPVRCGLDGLGSYLEAALMTSPLANGKGRAVSQLPHNFRTRSTARRTHK